VSRRLPEWRYDQRRRSGAEGAFPGSDES
jgi:hypothetical protein